MIRPTKFYSKKQKWSLLHSVALLRKFIRNREQKLLRQDYFIMQIMDIKIKKLLLTLQKQTIGCMQVVRDAHIEKMLASDWSRAGGI